MGFVIPLIVVRINLHPHSIWQTDIVLSIFILSLPLVLWIANVMLANNTCDLEEDLLNNRHTLVSYALTLLTIPFVLKQHLIFQQQQIKTKTFICSVRILIVTAVAQVVGFSIGLLF